ncbi:MAG: DUF1330 domain-containing protein [Deinococcales bacterium]
MPAYLLAQISVTDPEQYKQYTARTPEVIAKYGGKFIVRGAKPIVLEGPEVTKRLVLLEFPSSEIAQSFYYSAEYQELISLRKDAAEGSFVVLEGYETS